MSRCTVTSTTIPGRCCTWTSRNAATSPTVAAGASSGPRPGKAEPGTDPDKPKSEHRNRRWVTRSCTPSSTTTPVAYAEVHDDETAVTATAVLRRAAAWFASHGTTAERELSDKGSAYRSHLRRDTCGQLRIKHFRTQPLPAQTNSKIERFHRTMSDGWGYAHCYDSEGERRMALPSWLHRTTTTRPTPPAGTSHLPLA